MNKKALQRYLLNEINQMKDKRYGYLRAGFPRFPRLFGRDSLITSWQLLGLDSNIARDTLSILARFQGKEINREREEEPGKILHEYQIGKKKHPKGYFPFPYYGSVDSTPLFLIILSFYYQKTKDEEFVKRLWPNVLKALNWIFNFGDRDGDLFLEYKRKTKHSLFHQAWKDGFFNHLKISPPVEIVEVQGYQYLALVKTAILAKKIFGDIKLERSLNKRAGKLKERFNQKFWLPREKYYAFALDKNKKPYREITSNPGHLLFTGIIGSRAKEGRVVGKLFSPELWTKFGIRTHSSKSKMFNPLSYHLGSVWPHDNWIIAQGLKKCGYKKEYEKIKNALLKAYKELGYIPEFYGVVDNKITTKTIEKACHPQSWAIGALLNFLISYS